jgi:ribosome maturation factor RimP
MIPDERIRSVVESEVSLLGYEFLRLDLISRGRRRVLRLFIDSESGKVTIDDCVKVSKAVGLVIEGEEMMAGPYNLEVSSPGINRPLVKPAHFERFAGHGAKVEFRGAGAEKKTVIGEISRIEDGAVVIISDGIETVIPFDDVTRASLHGEDWSVGGSAGRGRRKRRRRG